MRPAAHWKRCSTICAVSPSRRRTLPRAGDRPKQRLRPRRPAATPSPRPDWWQRGTSIGALVSVVLVAVGLYLTNSFNRDQLRLQRETTQQQQDLALKGQRADRFVAAVDQLGQEGRNKLSIRLGGIYALEALMKDSPDDESSVIEVLCAFVRTHALRPKTIPKQIPDSPADIRAAVTVLGRRPKPDVHAALDLNSTLLGLHGANLAGASLSRASLSRADLSSAILIGADLSSANLSGANLSGAVLIRPSFVSDPVPERRSGVDGAKLSRTDLRGANLSGATVVSDQVACAYADTSTRLPVGVKRPLKDPDAIDFSGHSLCPD
jgi:hypothetical protein